MGMRATVKQYSIIVRTRKKKEKVRTKLEQEQIWNGFQGFPPTAPLSTRTDCVAEICECGDPSMINGPFQCPLCGEGETLPLPDRMIANRTCREREEIAGFVLSWSRTLIRGDI